ncbi:NADH dehydrogenase subunit 6 (mitochondrion) [Candida oxycetoniae]|uniref:NADH-ubiquinone oxidoreductase chain 6 n=1 Tax=Candida oxycetoniae TaxID=497107 RepID=S5U5E7_9ASCO|nr:NADH dehydrogenase subunit 6 [Candida oxycetoniae]AGS44326.1 NADH dehydrogenase subunit 6 [Candida oxycetoniae]
MTLISGICSLLAISLLSPVQSIVALIGLFVSVAINLYTSGYVLFGILYILIYVGAIAILFLFILSLLNIEYTYNNTINPLIFTIVIVCLIPLDLFYNNNLISIIDSNIEGISEIYLELNIVGAQLYTEYAIPLVLIGLILVLSIIGAISITKC